MAELHLETLRQPMGNTERLVNSCILASYWLNCIWQLYASQCGTKRAYTMFADVLLAELHLVTLRRPIGWRHCLLTVLLWFAAVPYYSFLRVLGRGAILRNARSERVQSGQPTPAHPGPLQPGRQPSAVGLQQQRWKPSDDGLCHVQPAHAAPRLLQVWTRTMKRRHFCANLQQGRPITCWACMLLSFCKWGAKIYETRVIMALPKGFNCYLYHFQLSPFQSFQKS